MVITETKINSNNAIFFSMGFTPSSPGVLGYCLADNLFYRGYTFPNLIKA
jgi:hypothetical protein